MRKLVFVWRLAGRRSRGLPEGQRAKLLRRWWQKSLPTSQSYASGDGANSGQGAILAVHAAVDAFPRRTDEVNSAGHGCPGRTNGDAVFLSAAAG
jgi:hypothetical protein